MTLRILFIVTKVPKVSLQLLMTNSIAGQIKTKSVARLFKAGNLRLKNVNLVQTDNNQIAK